MIRYDPGEDHAPTKFSISEVQGDRSARKSHQPFMYVCIFVFMYVCMYLFSKRIDI